MESQTTVVAGDIAGLHLLLTEKDKAVTSLNLCGTKELWGIGIDFPRFNDLNWRFRLSKRHSPTSTILLPWAGDAFGHLRRQFITLLAADAQRLRELLALSNADSFPELEQPISRLTIFLAEIAMELELREIESALQLFGEYQMQDDYQLHVRQPALF